MLSMHLMSGRPGSIFSWDKEVLASETPFLMTSSRSWLIKEDTLCSVILFKLSFRSINWVQGLLRQDLVHQYQFTGVFAVWSYVKSKTFDFYLKCILTNSIGIDEKNGWNKIILSNFQNSRYRFIASKIDASLSFCILNIMNKRIMPGPIILRKMEDVSWSQCQTRVEPSNMACVVAGASLHGMEGANIGHIPLSLSTYIHLDT